MPEALNVMPEKVLDSPVKNKSMSQRIKNYGFEIPVFGSIYTLRIYNSLICLYLKMGGNRMGSKK